jgi:ABC-type transport system involved in multi-copper enzyme maturation permease subunit
MATTSVASEAAPRFKPGWAPALVRSAAGAGLVLLAGMLFYRRINPWLAAAPLAVVVLYLLALSRHLFGPHLFYDPARLARRGRITGLRVLFLGALLFALSWTYQETPVVFSIATMSRITQQYTFAFFVLQNLTIVLLTPVYVGSAIAEERERRSLELLFTTRLRSSEIVLGILGGRLLLLSSFTLSAVPILCLLQLWGGVDMLLLLGNELNSVLLLGAVGSLCILASALAPTVVWGVVFSYALLFWPFLICGGMAAVEVGSPFVLYDARAGGAAHLTVQDSLLPLAISYLVVSVVSVALAILALRTEKFTVVDTESLPDPNAHALRGRQTAAPPTRVTVDEEKLAVRGNLPPIGDDALLWKECYSGGRALIFTPLVSSFMILYLLYGVPFFLVQPGAETRFIILMVYYHAFVLFYAAGVVFRATASVARERERQTLDMLLQIPDDARTILWAKWKGAAWKGWPWLAFAAANAALGLAMGLYPPLLALWLLVAPLPLLILLASLALLLSVTLASVLRARMVLVILFLALFFGVGRGQYNPIPGLPLAPGFEGTSHIGVLSQLPAQLVLPVYLLTVGWQAMYLAAAAGLGAAALFLFATPGRRAPDVTFRPRLGQGSASIDLAGTSEPEA